MKKFIVDILIVLVPVFSVLISVNYCGDPAHKLDNDYEQRIVEMMQGGHAVTNVDNCDERKLKKLLIEANKDKAFDYLIFGSSRCMTMSQKTMNVNLFNLGVSGATIQDFLALIELCHENNITYNNVIVSIDPGLLNCRNTDYRWQSIKEYYDKILGIEDIKRKDDDQLLNVLLSGSYFQSSFKAILKNGFSFSDDLSVSVKDENDNQTNFPDGSITYGATYRNTPQSIIDSYANNQLRQEFQSYTNIADEYKKHLDLFLSKVSENGQSVTFITFPYMDGYYRRLIKMNGVKEQEIYLQHLADNRKYKTYGSLNPNIVNVKNTDFYDELHLRRDIITKLCKEYNIFDNERLFKNN